MKNVSRVLVLLAATSVSESPALKLKHFIRHPKDIVRHPKKLVTAVVRTVENKVLEPVAHATEKQASVAIKTTEKGVRIAAKGANDHVIKPFCRGFKRKLEEHSEQDGKVAADLAHDVVVAALTGQEQVGGESPAKRTRH